MNNYPPTLPELATEKGWEVWDSNVFVPQPQVTICVQVKCSITISGAKGVHADVINGSYEATSKASGGYPRLKKKNEAVWLECSLKNSERTENKWVVKYKKGPKDASSASSVRTSLVVASSTKTTESASSSASTAMEVVDAAAEFPSSITAVESTTSTSTSAAVKEEGHQIVAWCAFELQSLEKLQYHTLPHLLPESASWFVLETEQGIFVKQSALVVTSNGVELDYESKRKAQNSSLSEQAPKKGKSSASTKSSSSHRPSSSSSTTNSRDGLSLLDGWSEWSEQTQTPLKSPFNNAYPSFLIEGAENEDAVLNGYYLPTYEMCYDLPVYRKLNDHDTFMQYYGPSKKWFVQPTSSRGKGEGMAYLHSVPPSLPHVAQKNGSHWLCPDFRAFAVRKNITISECDMPKEATDNFAVCPIMIQNVTGNNRDVRVNGMYFPLDGEFYNGQPVYKKESIEDAYLEYFEQGRMWIVRSLAKRGSNLGWACVHCDPPTLPERCRQGQWKILGAQGGGWENQPLVRVLHNPWLERVDVACVQVSGARGLFSAKINGIYEPTNDYACGFSRYRKRDDNDQWLEYHEQNKVNKHTQTHTHNTHTHTHFVSHVHDTYTNKLLRVAHTLTHTYTHTHTHTYTHTHIHTYTHTHIHTYIHSTGSSQPLLESARAKESPFSKTIHPLCRNKRVHRKCGVFLMANVGKRNTNSE